MTRVSPLRARALHHSSCVTLRLRFNLPQPGVSIIRAAPQRLWRSVKYEEVYLRAYESVGEARTSIGRYLDFYNARRPHSSLDGSTPDQAYFNALPLRLAA